MSISHKFYHDANGTRVFKGDLVMYNNRLYEVKSICNGGWLILKSEDHRRIGTFASQVVKAFEYEQNPLYDSLWW